MRNFLFSARSRGGERDELRDVMGSAGASGPLAVAVVRSPLWTGDDAEDLWQVEVPREATVGDLKLQIEELYGLPAAAQRVQRCAEQSGAAIDDRTPVSEVLAGCNLVHLLPALPSANEEEEFEELDFRLFHAQEEERLQAERAVEESLRGVKWSLRFLRPDSCGGKAAGRSVTLQFEALATAGEVQEAVCTKMLGSFFSSSREPGHLWFNGRPLPGQAPIYLLGISDGDTVLLSDQLPEVLPSDDEEGGDDFDAALSRWAGGDARGEGGGGGGLGLGRSGGGGRLGLGRGGGGGLGLE